MDEAIALARAAAERGEVPVGAVVVLDGEIIGRGANARETDNDPTAHAEIIALREAAAAMQSWRLSDAALYVTLEPCAMCAGAIVLARVKQVIYGADDPKAGACGSVLDITACQPLNHQPEMLGGIRQDVCSALLKDFFAARRH